LNDRAARSISPRVPTTLGASHRLRTPEPEFRSAVPHIETACGAARADAQGDRSRPVVSPRVPQPDGHRLHFRSPSDFTALDVVRPARWRGIKVYNSVRGSAVPDQRVELRPARGSTDLRRLRVWGLRRDCPVAPSCSAADPQHTLNATAISRTRPNQIRFCDAHDRRIRFTTHSNSRAPMNSVVGCIQTSASLQASLASRRDQLEYRQNHAVRGRLQMRRVRLGSRW